MKGDFISCYLLLQPTLRNISCEKKLNRPNNGNIAQLSKYVQNNYAPRFAHFGQISAFGTWTTKCTKVVR